jgi:hypothetical protein
MDVLLARNEGPGIAKHDAGDGVIINKMHTIKKRGQRRWKDDS